MFVAGMAVTVCAEDHDAWHIVVGRAALISGYLDVCARREGDAATGMKRAESG